jgi:RNA polymerase sigma factor (sigma-70 family)
VYSVLRAHAANRLRASGSEADRLAQLGGKLTDPETDSALEDFELREILRQLVQAAGLSPRQAEVLDRVQGGMEDAEIAADLGITRNNVYATKSTAIKKVMKAFEAASL